MKYVDKIKAEQFTGNTPSLGSGVNSATKGKKEDTMQ